MQCRYLLCPLAAICSYIVCVCRLAFLPSLAVRINICINEISFFKGTNLLYFFFF